MENKSASLTIVNYYNKIEKIIKDKKEVYSNLLNKLFREYIAQDNNYKIISRYNYDNTYTISFFDKINNYKLIFENITTKDMERGVSHNE